MAENPLKYVYFDARARGELPRLVVAATGLNIDQERVKFGDFAEQIKPHTPYEQLPCLVVDNKWYAQKMAISIYLAEISDKDILGQNPIERLKINHCLYFSDDVLEQIILGYINEMENLGSDLLNKVKEKVLPLKMSMMEKNLIENGTGYFVGNRMTIADLSAVDLLRHVIDVKGREFLDQYPNVKANFEKTCKLPGICEYLEKCQKETPEFPW